MWINIIKNLTKFFLTEHNLSNIIGMMFSNNFCYFIRNFIFYNNTNLVEGGVPL